MSRRLLDCEIARLTGYRSQQLLDGAPPRILIGRETDSLMIARMELAQKKIPLLFFDPVSETWLDPNMLVTPETIKWLRLTYLSDWPEKQAETDF